MLDVHRGDHRNALFEQVEDVLPTFLVRARARHVRVGELVDEGDFGVALDDCSSVHLLELRTPVRHLLAGNDLQAVDCLQGEGAPVSLHKADDDVGPSLCPPAPFVEHGAGLSDTGRRAEIEPELAGGFDAFGDLLSGIRHGRILRSK